MNALPTGTVTFLFTDIEGSTRRLEAEPAAYRDALGRHDAILRTAISAQAGSVVQNRGDGFCAAFPNAADAAQAALDGQQSLLRETWGVAGPLKVRMALHTGDVELRGEEYFGAPLHRCARLLDSAHGGQIVLSSVTAALVADALPPDTSLRDLGEHRLRDLARPEHVYQIVGTGLRADFPPLRTLTHPPSHLPPRATAFIGREQQIAAVRAAVLEPETRLVTLTGPGGTGKTRLAVEVATELLEMFSDGVFFVALASVTTPELVLSAIAQALDAREVTGRSLMASLGAALRPRPVLLVLDNFEQVIAAAPIVAALLADAPGLTALVTSRAVLRLYGEREYPVPPLALPDRRATPTAAHLSQFEAVRLFVDRAQAARPDFTIDDENAGGIGEICQRLDGLPLAIELAAARIRALTPGAMLRRMERRLPLLTGGARDLPARQRTLRDAIAWSYDLLEPDEQALFCRLAVFRGCTLEAAESVCAGAPSQPGATSVALAPLDIEVLDGIESLVEKSLLRRVEGVDGEPWYLMLETVREYALERLVESADADAVHRRHVLACMRLAESSEVELYGTEQTIWIARLEQEHDNLRSALDWSEGHGYAVPALRLGVSLWWFWSIHGHVTEGRQRLGRLLVRFPQAEPVARAELRARALHGAGMLSAAQGDYDAAGKLLQDGLAIRRAIGERLGLINALEGIGTVECIQQEYVAARQHLEEAAALARDLDDPLSYASVLNTLGTVVYELGDLTTARAYLRESVAAYQRSPGPYPVFNGAMLSSAVVAQDAGEHAAAQVLASEALAAVRQVRNRRLEGLALAIAGGIAQSQGDWGLAHKHLRESIEVYRELGDVKGVGEVLERFVELAAARGEYVGALRLAGAATTLQQQAGAARPPSSQARLDRALEPARRTLGETAPHVAWEEGRALDLDGAIAAALAITEPSPTGDGGSARRAPGESAGAARAASALTPREQEVAALIARGLTNRQISEALVITEGTAANHVVHILNKLGYSSRAQVAVWAAEHGLTSSTDPA
jgi:predicted ATPase/class 3 adenylate cyclase/DNA-binding CsgD family transcriptional regulator